MSNNPEPVLKVKLGFRRLKPEGVLSSSTHVFTEIYGNNDFTPPQAPAPPVDQATLKAGNDSLAASIAAAVGGGKQAIALKQSCKEAVVKMLEQLGAYVQANCKGSMTILLSSGFTAASSTKTPTPPVSESIRKIHPGDVSGQVKATLMRYAGAVSYELRWAPVPIGGTPGAWASMPVAMLRPPTVVSGLTPAMTYIFQARAVTASGYSDWSDSVTRVVM